MKDLKLYVEDMCSKYPNIKDDIEELYYLCINSIEEGESEAHEIELCINDIEELIALNSL